MGGIGATGDESFKKGAEPPMSPPDWKPWAGTDRVAVDFREVCRRTVENAAQVETGGFRHAGTSITRYTS